MRNKPMAGVLSNTFIFHLAETTMGEEEVSGGLKCARAVENKKFIYENQLYKK